MSKCIDWRISFSIWAIGALLMVVLLPHAHSANFPEPPSVVPASSHPVALDLPRVEAIQISVSLKTFGEMLDRLEMLDEEDAPASFVAALHTASVVSTTEFPLASVFEVAAEAVDRGSLLAINSESPGACRADGVARSAYNYGAVAESECTCELYQRSPATRFGNATAKDFHWVKSCKKARYKAG
jgi:hypothetical protein